MHESFNGFGDFRDYLQQITTAAMLADCCSTGHDHWLQYFALRLRDNALHSYTTLSPEQQAEYDLLVDALHWRVHPSFSGRHLQCTFELILKSNPFPIHICYLTTISFLPTVNLVSLKIAFPRLMSAKFLTLHSVSFRAFAYKQLVLPVNVSGLFRIIIRFRMATLVVSFSLYTSP